MNKAKIVKQTNSSHKKTPNRNWRLYSLVLIVFFIAIIIVGKLYVLQIHRYQTYVALAENQHETSTELKAIRGEIFLQDENEPYPVAVNRELQMVYAVPREMNDIGLAIESLCGILSMDRNILKEKLNDPEDMFEIIKKKLSDDEVAKIREAKISGIYLMPESFRYYPAGELGSQVVGFVGSNGDQKKGMYGVEASLEKVLKGESGMLNQEGDSRGRWISVSDRSVQEAKNGPDVILTINHTVQFEVEKILKAAMDKFSADGATAVVMESKTGKILAMANQPSFNPNDFASTEDISKFNNPAVSEPYESGSVFKAFTEAIGMDDGKINPDTTYVDTGVVVEAGYDIRNSDLKANGVQTMTQVLEKSLNTGVIYIEKLVGNKKFGEYVKMFGFGEKTEIDVPGEVPGNTRNLLNPNSTINFFTASFGQGISVTPLQLAAGYGALANNGTLMKPQIIEELRYDNGEVEKIQPKEVRQVISSEASKQISIMLRNVVTNGHGKQADVPGYLVGGKTGTAQVAKTGSKGYEEGINVGSFAGYAPTNDPKFVIVVKLINPKGVEWAESSAAPTFGQIMKFLLEYYKVKPTEDPTKSPTYKTYQGAPIVPATAVVNEEIKKPSDSVKSEKDKKKSESKKENAKIITSGD